MLSRMEDLIDSVAAFTVLEWKSFSKIMLYLQSIELVMISVF
jgi:hypothetical protein